MKKRISIDADRIKKEMDYWQIPGMAVVLIQDGEPDQIACFGWRDAEKQLEVNEDTKFCVASCSKSMTAALIAALADEGVLDLDVPVCRYVPEMKMWDEGTSREMTLRDMLCHRTGLGGYDILWPNEEGRACTAERLRYLQPNKPFRSVAQYSNLIYIMAGYVAEKVTGCDWPQLMKTYVFDPLGMDRTCCLGEEITGDENHAEPHQIIDGKLTRLSFWNMDMAGPAASVNSTARDMAKWLHFHIDGGKNGEGKQILSEKNFRQMHEPQITYDDGGCPGGDCYTCQGYGLGWRVGTYRGLRIQKHTGKIEGYSTIQFYLPDEKIGFAFLMNLHSPSNPIFYPLIYSMIDRIFGLEDRNWMEYYPKQDQHAPTKVYEDCNLDVTQGRLPEEEKGIPFAEEEAAWVGTYEEPGYGSMKIEYRANEDDSGTGSKNGAGEKQLYLTYRDQTLLLQHWGKEKYWMDGVKADILTMRVPVTLDREGDQYFVNICYEPLTVPARFMRIK